MGNGIETGGRKDDQGKLRLDLVPPEAVEALGRVLTYGAGKYGDRNWERGIVESRLIAALLRHLMRDARGESCDDESGLPHVEHALCNLAMLVALRERGEKPRQDAPGSTQARPSVSSVADGDRMQHAGCQGPKMCQCELCRSLWEGRNG